MIKRHAFSFSGWIVTLLFALAWRHNLKDKKEYEKEAHQEELRKGNEKNYINYVFFLQKNHQKI